MPESKARPFQRRIEWIQSRDGVLLAFPAVGPIEKGKQAIVGDDIAEALVAAGLAKDLGAYDPLADRTAATVKTEAKPGPKPEKE